MYWTQGSPRIPDVSHLPGQELPPWALRGLIWESAVALVSVIHRCATNLAKTQWRNHYYISSLPSLDWQGAAAVWGLNEATKFNMPHPCGCQLGAGQGLLMKSLHLADLLMCLGFPQHCSCDWEECLKSKSSKKEVAFGSTDLGFVSDSMALDNLKNLLKCHIHIQ